jgi:hypothetical protein
VAVATGDAFPVAFVSLVIAFAVAVPLDASANASADSGSVATAVPGLPTVPVRRNTRLPDAPIKAVTESVAALRAAVECVTAMFVLQYLLEFLGVRVAHKFHRLYLAGFLALYLNRHAQFTGLSL